MLLEDLRQGEAGRHVINPACWVRLLFGGGWKQANCLLIREESPSEHLAHEQTNVVKCEKSYRNLVESTHVF